MPPRSLKLVMMGTGDFAVPTLRGLYDTPHPVVALFTQPDPSGPGRHKSHVNGMKRLAEEHGTPVFQPQNVNAPGTLAELRALEADVFVVAAYGQILSPELLSIPDRATINVHASLLPKYRGAAPVAYAILKGETETGVSIIQVLPRLDAGPILAVARTPIAPHETAGELEDRLAALAVPLVPAVLAQIATGTTQPVAQAEELVTRAPKLKKEQGAIDWTQSAPQIDCHVRGMQPWPNAFTWVHAAGKPPFRVLVLAVGIDRSAAPSTATPGAVLRADNSGLWIQSGTGPVEVIRLQPDGKRAMSAADFLRGNPLQTGDRLGTAAPGSP
jgi:methionyl-tRNA formyltransferase